jgi:hypothetical protein
VDQAPDPPVRGPLRPPTSPRAARQPIKTVSPSAPVKAVQHQPVSDNGSITPAVASTALSLQHAADDIRRYVRDGLNWPQIKWRLDHSGIAAPAPFKHWGRTAITETILAFPSRKRRPPKPVMELAKAATHSA